MTDNKYFMESNEIKNTEDSKKQPKTRWIINRDLCTGCGECVDACPDSLLAIVKKKVIIKDETICPECSECAMACTTRAITLV